MTPSVIRDARVSVFNFKERCHHEFFKLDGWQVNSEEDSVQGLIECCLQHFFNLHVISLDSRDQRKNVVGSMKSFVTDSGSEFGISAANLQRAHGGCLGVKS